MQNLWTREYRLPDWLLRPLTLIGKTLASLLGLMGGFAIVQMCLEANRAHAYERFALILGVSRGWGPVFYSVGMISAFVALLSAYAIWKMKKPGLLFIAWISGANLASAQDFLQLGPSRAHSDAVKVVAISAVVWIACLSEFCFRNVYDRRSKLNPAGS